MLSKIPQVEKAKRRVKGKQFCGKDQFSWVSMMPLPKESESNKIKLIPEKYKVLKVSRSREDLVEKSESQKWDEEGEQATIIHGLLQQRTKGHTG